MKQLLLLCCVMFLANANANGIALSPARSLLYGPLLAAAGDPPTSSQLTKPSTKGSDLVPSVAGDKSIAPESSAGSIPPGLDQPQISPSSSNCCKQDMVLRRGTQGCHCVYPIKLDILLLNVSTSPNWKLFLDDFAKQLGLEVSQIELINFYVLNFAKLNISMVITPHSGVSFSTSDASAITSSLMMRKVKLDPSLVSDYKLLNITWFKPPPPSQAPVATSSLETPPKPSPALQSTSDLDKRKHSNWNHIIGIGAGILFLAITYVLILRLCAFRKEKVKACPPETAPEKQRSLDTVLPVGSLPHPSSTRFLGYEELKQATNNFESASILGEGGFGKVFKGVLSDGTAVAIKRLTNGGQQGDKEFLVEVEMLSRLHHRNLVKLVGYYSSRDSSQNLLCYELVPNGSLEAWLHGPLGLNCRLDWDTRMKIALDAARGLAYLHEDSQPCVIHRDFKASNILLENDFHAKVADFGLAKQAPEGRTNYLSTRVMGTFGYVAPEYAMTGHLLVKSDVYSYGVVLLELLTGRRPVDMSQPSGQENLVTWAPEGRTNYLSTRVMGTFGYVAPEYAMTGHLLVKSDVYSYGVVLLELLTGRRPVDMSQPSGQENLVTWAPEGRTNYLSTRVMGTFGYVAPEYAMTGHLLFKSDVYSYGVVLLELLTGRRPVDMSQPSGQENLVTWARPILRDKERLDELADPSLGAKYPTEDFIRLCTIAAACVAPEANQRPTMGEVVQSLKMVQRITEYQDSVLTASTAIPNQKQSSTTFESDVSSSMFSSGPYSGLSAFDNDTMSRTAVFSEDLHEGR